MAITEEEHNWGGDDTRPRNVRDVIKVCVWGEGAGLGGDSLQATCRGTLLVSVCFSGAGEEEPGGA